MKTPKFPTRAATSGRLPLGSNTLFLALGIWIAGFTANSAAAPGDLDSNFGTNGVAIARIDYSSSQGVRNDRIADMALQSDGKIVAVGSTVPNPAGLKETAIARFDPDGTLDATFGFGGKAVYGFGSYHDEARSVALQADGKIVIAGYANNDSSWGRIFVARLKPDGTRDESFGQNGVTMLDRRNSNASESAYVVGIQPNGKILVAGVSPDGNWPSYSVLARLDENGVLDPIFGKNSHRESHPAVNVCISRR